MRGSRGVKPGTVGETVLSYVASEPGEWTARTIAEDLGRGTNATSCVVTDLRNRGLLRPKLDGDRGLLRPTEEGVVAIRSARRRRTVASALVSAAALVEDRDPALSDDLLGIARRLPRRIREGGTRGERWEPTEER